MIYVWQHKETKVEVEVERPMDDYKIPPTPAEIGDASDDHNPDNWTRLLVGGSCTINFGLKGAYGQA